MSENYDERVILAQRNISAMNEGMKHFERKRAEDSQRVEQLMSTVAALATEVAQLRQTVAVLRAMSHGGGPTA